MKKKWIGLAFVFTAGLLVGAVFINDVPPSLQQNHFESVKIDKKRILREIATHSHDHAGATFKNQGPLQLSLHRESSKERGEMHLLFAVEASEDLHWPIRIQWSMPPGISLLEDPVQEIASMKRGEILTFKIRTEVIGEVVDPLRVVAVAGDHRYGFSAETSYDLQHQTDIDQASELLKERASAYMKSRLDSKTGSKNLNVFQ